MGSDKEGLGEDSPKGPPPKQYPLYAGPRPDEELLEAMRIEAEVGDEASVEAIYELLRSGEDVNQRSANGFTPLAVAAAAGNGPLVSILLERRADVGLATIHRAELPIHYAARSGNSTVLQLLAEGCRSRGMIDAPNVTGWPPLHLAVAGGHLNAIAILIRNGAQPQSRNNLQGGHTALHVAVRLGYRDIAESLLEREADVDPRDFVGRGPVHFAAARGDHQLVSLLLRSRADANSKGPGGLGPLDLLPEGHPGRDKLFTLLQAYSRPPPEVRRTDVRFDRRDSKALI